MTKLSLKPYTPANLLARTNNMFSELDKFIPSSMTFDSIFKDFDEFLNVPAGMDLSIGYPPCNVVKAAEDKYEIHLAVAGFKKDEISIKSANDVLTIAGKKITEVKSEESEFPQYFHKGIATREFVKKFSLPQHAQVGDVTLEDGILTITLDRLLPESAKEKTYLIK
jgi:molecular chaperone IbpA